MSIASSRSLKAVLVPLLLAAVLLTQGLRLCLHAPAPDTANPGQTHTAAIHLENDLISSPDLDDARNGHVSPTFAFFKFGKFVDGFTIAAILTATLFLFLPRQSVRVPAPVEAVPALSGGHRFRPPLRAPPR